MKKKRFIDKYILPLQFIFRPSYWFMYGNYSEEHDKLMRYLMDNNEFEYVSKCRAKLGGLYVWTENQPYAAIAITTSPLLGTRPSRLTILRGIKKLNKELGDYENKVVKDFVREHISEK